MRSWLKKTRKSSVSLPLSGERKQRAERNQGAYLCVFKHRRENNSTAFPHPPQILLEATGLISEHRADDKGYQSIQSPQDTWVLFLGPSTVCTCAQPQLCTACWTGGNCTTARLQDGIFSTLSVTQSCLGAFHLSPLAGNRAATVNSYSLAHQQVF